ncbi:hypothetical protein KEM55_005049 [Ascosphaera atra]|nr:hypothetical protein KEM55_005049 [Ascosphaera atra]
MNNQGALIDPVDTPLARAGGLQAEYLAALASDEELGSTVNTPGPQTQSASRRGVIRSLLGLR